ncbi:DUF2484 family protein [Paracoccus sp. (in: a-proteobacteria)]|uniref:DUF2484 family protein n=1 Tax=Paracoccus sp. TaxID=267 RepID=UPI00396C82EE
MTGLPPVQGVTAPFVLPITLPPGLVLSQPVAALVLAGGWLCLAWWLPRLPFRWRRHLLAGLVVLGVPILGWLTLLWGPGLGVLGLGLGLGLLLSRQRVRRGASVPSAAGPEGQA